MTEMDIDEIEAATEIDLYDIYRRAFSPKIVFESFGELLVESSFDPTQNKDHEWRYATVKFREAHFRYRWWQALNHMAEDKVKFRNTGPVHPLTRQPVTDRNRFGGIKFGEIERDCLIAHGASANMHERLFSLK
ncbi:BnaA01g26990D [Brassica napus]|uniref:DNA-directed RNA polymerase n=3 Tax=Brassica TaxID=3705 RepID=A0A078FZN9_BRANA|nr:unnamed protein product [Brassica napus]CDY18496.1 BnaA01g26990D [Brassica napus]